MTKIKLFRLFVVFVFMSATKFYAQSTITRPYKTGYFCSVFMSSPVVGQNIGDTYKHLDNGGLSGNTFIPSLSYNQSRWNPVTGQWITINRATIMQPGVGYVETTPPNGVGNYSAIAFELPYNQSYTGNFTVNDGDITVPMVVGVSSFNLIGNPYPDFLDADSFLLDPDNTNISGTIFLWTHNTVSSNLTPGIYQSNFTPSDYAMYNLLGGVAAGRSTSSVAGSNQVATSTVEVKKPNGKIYMGTAFFVRAINGGGTIKFKNDMRIATIPTTPQYFRSENEQRIATPPARHRIWINLEQSNGTPATSPLSQTLIGYVAGATTGENDRCFDNGTFVFTINPKVNIYSLADVNSPKKLAIQGRDILPTFDVSDKFKLGFTGLVPLNTTQTFTINAEGDGLFAAGGQPYYLKDNLTGQIVSFPYTFTLNSDEINNNGRFEVVFDAVTTQLQPQYCNYTIPTNTSLVFAIPVPGATSYQWNITQVLPPNSTATPLTINPITNLSQLTLGYWGNLVPNFFVYGMSYNVTVRPIKPGITTGFGAVCQVTMAKPVVQLAQCSGNYVVPNSTTFISTNMSIPLLSKYEWEVTNMSTDVVKSFITSINAFIFGNAYIFPTSSNFVTPGTEYCIRVRAINTDNTPLDFSTVCCITTAALFTKSVEGSYVYESQSVIAYPNPFTKSFSLNLESSINEEVIIKVYDVLGKLLEDKQVNLSISKNIEIGGNYQTGIYNVVVFDGDLVKATRVIKN